MLNKYQVIYSGDLAAPSAGVVGFYVLSPGTVKNVRVLTNPDEPNTAGDARFNLTKNGTELFTDELTLEQNETEVSIEGEAIAVVRGDYLILTLETMPAGGVAGPIALQVESDEPLDLSAADLAALKTDLDLSGTNSGDETAASIGALVSGAASKATPVDADQFALADSAAGGVLKKLSWANLKATLKTYFDTLYQAILISGTNIKTINGSSLLGSGDLTVSGGGGGGNFAGGTFSVDGKPASDLHPKSDYFEDETATLAGFTAFQGTLHRLVVEGGRAKMIMPSTSSEQTTGRFKTLPAGDCTIIAKLWNPGPLLNYCSIGIALFQDAGGNPNTTDYISIRLEKNTANAYRAGVAHYSSYTTPVAYIGALTNLTADQVPLYVKFVRSATTWTAYYSGGGRIWTQVGNSFTQASYFAPAEMGIVAINMTHGQTTSFECDFFYFYDSAAAFLPGGDGSAIESGVTQRMICLGDSITQGFGVSEIDAYPNKLADSLSAVAVGYDGNVFRADDGARSWKVINKGINSYTTQNIIDRFMTNTILRRDAALARDLVVVFAGTNDLAAGDSGATVYGRLTTIVTTLQAAGFEVAVCTAIDRDGTAGFDTRRGDYNTLVTANTAGADLVIDLYADARLQDAASGTYFIGDGIHPNAAGMGVIAEIIEAAL